MKKEIFPQWVNVDGQIHRVSEFAHLPPSSRPKATCPLCINPVIMKLGKIRVPHYAHQPDIICSATQPETALHLNTKYHIYEQLKKGKKLYVEQQCIYGCGESRKIIWAENWKKVNVESNLGLYRPDISITSDYENINAIEIKVTHNVEDDKENFYKTHNIAWLEVDASESIYEGENVWTIEQSLPFTTCNPPLVEWICTVCHERIRKIKELELREQKEREYRKHNFTETICVKMVDFYYKSGKKHRDIFYLKKVVRNDRLSILVNTEKNEWAWGQSGEDFEILKESALQAVNTRVDLKRSSAQHVHEWEWAPWKYGRKYCAKAIERFPYSNQWDKNTRKWVTREHQQVYSRYMRSDEPDTQSHETSQEKHINSQDIQAGMKREGVCTFCGQITTDWWSFDGASNTCKCKKCKLDGKY